VAELTVAVAGAVPDLYAAVPTLMLDLRVTDPSGERIHALALRAQVRIEPQRRHYSEEEVERLADLFGPPTQWGESLRPFLWTQAGTIVGSFTGTSEVELPIVGTYDFEVAAARYLHGLDDGEIPLVLLFSGTIFRAGTAGLVVEPVPWHVETRYRLPVPVWRGLMDRYFPGSGWLRLRRETIDALGRFRTKEAIPTWEAAIERLLERERVEP
jgi:Family of unknown function (DUF6084)